MASATPLCLIFERKELSIQSFVSREALLRKKKKRSLCACISLTEHFETWEISGCTSQGRGFLNPEIAPLMIDNGDEGRF